MTTSYDQLNGVVGSDRIAPIYNPSAFYQRRALRDVFVPGGPGDGRVVPNIGDLIDDVYDDGVIPVQRVVAIDIITGASTLVPWGQVPSALVDNDDLLTGIGNITESSTFVLCVDKNVTPYTCLVDGRLIYPNPEVAYVRVIRGAVLVDNPNVVSLYYDDQGNLLGNDIPTRGVLLNSNTAPSGIATAKYIPTFHTLEELEDNEVVTVIGYSAAGHVATKRQLRVENNGFLAPRNNATKTVTHVSLESPFMSETDSNLIELPVNVPLQGLYMRGVVHYSDGSTRKYPIDNVRFTILGMRDFVATAENIQVPLLLRYTMADNEASYGAVVTDERYMRARYRILTKGAIGAYNVKLYAYPEWIDAVQGYGLRFYLYNSDRNLKYDVTSLVEFAQNSEPFRPTLYGVMQNLSVAVNLGQVSPGYVNYRFNTTIQMVLWRQGTEKQTNWTIYFSPGQTPPFGEDNHASLKYINSNYYLLKLDSGCANVTEWVDRLYTRTLPIFDSTKETAAPMPTHFRVKVGNNTSEYPLSEWNKTHQVLAGLTYWKTVYIQWISKTPSSELELGITGLPLWEDPNLVVPVGG